MGILWTIVIGFVAGTIAKFIMPGKEPGLFVMTTLLGIGGAFVATFLGKMVGWYSIGDAAGFIGATVGAIIILFAYNFFKNKK